MDAQLIGLFQNIGWAGVIGLLIWKVLTPLVVWYTKRENNAGANGKNTQIKEMFNSMRTNDLHELNDKLDQIISLLKEERFMKAETNKKITFLYEQGIRNNDRSR